MPMKQRSPWRLISSAIATAALVGGSLALGAPAAHADAPIGGCSISGNSNNAVGITRATDCPRLSKLRPNLVLDITVAPAYTVH